VQIDVGLPRRTVEVVCAAGPLPLELVVSGREITEPRLSPDGSSVAFVHRRASVAAISVVGIDPPSPERLLTFGPDPSPGRGMGGGCFCWLPMSDGVIHAARDGELWMVHGARLERLTAQERTCRAPAIVGSLVAYVVEEAEVWVTDLRTGVARRVDDGRHEFCFDPSISPDGTVMSWLGWSRPDMPWDAAERVDARLDPLPTVISTWGPVAGAVQQPRFAPDGTPTCVHDGSGWSNLHIGEERAAGGTGDAVLGRSRRADRSVATVAFRAAHRRTGGAVGPPGTSCVVDPDVARPAPDHGRRVLVVPAGATSNGAWGRLDVDDTAVLIAHAHAGAGRRRRQP
jgi:hypothetical protein